MTAEVVTLHQWYGATPDEWLHFDLGLGLTADLLPVVSRPGAQISRQSTLKGLGKTPSVYNAERKVVGIPHWTQKIATDANIERWSKERDYGICVQTRRVRALDIDVPDQELADAIGLHFLNALYDDPAGGEHPWPHRTRKGTGKQLLAFELIGQFPKRSFKVDGGLVEFLGNGQQFVAIGEHFDGKGEPTGTRYEWPSGLPLRFPQIGQEAFERAWLAIVEAFALEPATEGAEGSDRGRDDLEGVIDPVAIYLDEQGLVIGAQGEKLFVTCPWKEGHTSDSGISETAWLVAGTKGFQHGHFQCMHASCQKRTDTDFLDAVGYRANAFADLDAGLHDGASEGAADIHGDGEGTHEEPVGVPWPTFKRDGKGAIEGTLHNLQLALSRADISGSYLIFDTFQDVLLADGKPFTDADAVRIRTLLERRGFKPIGRELFRDALLAHQDTHKFDSAIRWLTSLPPWDGVERVERFFSRYFRTEDTPYTRAVGRYAWTALAGRVMDPGCKADMVVALQGEQGQGKSGGIERIAPNEDSFREIGLHKMDADLSRKLRGCVVGELAELRGLMTRDAETIRAWIVQKTERWVPKYMEREMTFKRRCVFFASVNPETFLSDDEGERRWLPMRVPRRVDWAGIEQDREQLWAEGLLMWELGEGVAWAEAERLAKAEHASFKVSDSWTPVIEKWLSEPLDVSGETPLERGELTVTDVAVGALGLEMRNVRRSEEIRIGKALRELGWTSAIVRHGEKVVRRWIVTDK